MKAKDMAAHVPGWFRTKGEWMGSRPFYVRYLKKREGRTAEWCTSHTLKATGVGVIYRVETGELEECAMVEHLNVGQIEKVITRDEVIAYFESKATAVIAEARHKESVEAALPIVSKALEAAGFPHRMNYNTILFTDSHVLEYVKTHGLVPEKEGNR